MQRWLILTLVTLVFTGCASVITAASPTITPTLSPSATTDSNSRVIAPVQPVTSPTFEVGVGWKTFVSTNLEVAVDYPPDWSVTEQATGISFVSMHGAVIDLSVIDTGGISPDDFLNEEQLPNTRCSSHVNPHGITVRVCFDTLARSYIADFVMIRSDGSASLLSLATLRYDALPVFNAMISSVRPAP